MNAPIDPLQFIPLVDPSLYERSGSVFYSGRSAFSAPSKLYVLGLNPGGDATAQANATVQSHLADWAERLPARWSAYSDEIWRGNEPGAHGMQPRVRHMFNALMLDPHDVPASNVVFVRSNREATLAEKSALLEQCWQLHQAVIDKLGITTILCFGQTAGWWVRSRVGANRKIGQFVECNARRWTSVVYETAKGMAVMVATHPSIANWRDPKTDPTPLLRTILAERSGSRV